MGIFNVDNKFMHVMGKLVDLVALSAMWTVLSLPVVTLGASSAALYRAVVVSIRQDSGNVIRDYLHSFKKNLKQGSLLMLLSLAAVLFIASSFIYGYVSRDKGLLPTIYFYLSFPMALLFLMLQVNMFALLGRFSLTNKEILKISLGMLPGCFFQNLLLVFWLLLCGALTAVYPPVILILPAGYGFLCSLLQEKMFPRFVKFTDKRQLDASQL